MPDTLIEVHCNGRAWKWLTERTSDPDTLRAIARARREPWGKGFRAWFFITRLQAEQTIELLDELERRRMPDKVPTRKADDTTFTRAARDIRKCVNTWLQAHSDPSSVSR